MAVLIFAIAAVACSQRALQGVVPASSSAVASLSADSHSNFKTLLDFDGSYAGAGPGAGLIALPPNFYGTTTAGGLFGYGIVFRLTADGKEKVLHSFHYDGYYSAAPLLRRGKTFYGTTAGGGSHSSGSVFSLDANGRENWVYDFKGAPDGEAPYAGLVELGGTLFGTTEYGGSGGACGNYTCGTVFQISTSGHERVIYSFQGGGDGENPLDGLINLNGKLYGTAYGGRYKGGIVFSLTAAGKKTVIYNFRNTPSDGQEPNGLVALGGKLYGTTVFGGTENEGTVFSVSLAGKEQVLHSFGASSGLDGSNPQTALIAYNGQLYGTSSQGGVGRNGIVFEISTTGSLKVLHSFTGPDGSDPIGSLLEVGGKLYGTTFGGGNDDDGVVFELTP
ncbi:MAG: hypothetical protein JOZ77_02055 [Candidatus Eremiobacteraeota bacterium]|nr:hypothetical protein [Candidatus Eremiobacteraeota bacterium]